MSRKDRKDRAGLRPAIIDLKASEVTPDSPETEQRPAEHVSDPVAAAASPTDETLAAAEQRAAEERNEEAARSEPWNDPEPVLAETAAAQAVNSERTPPEPEPEPDRPAESNQAPAEARKRSRTGTWAAALLASAAIGGGGAWWLLNQDGPGAEVAALKQQLAGTESRIETLSRDLADARSAVGRVSSDVKTFGDQQRASLAAVEQKIGSAGGVQQADVDQLKQQLSEHASALGKLEAAVTEVKSAISAAGQDGSAGAVSADIQLKVGELATRLDDLTAKLTAMPAAGAGDVKSTLDQLATRLDAMDKRVSEGLEASKASAAAPKAVVDAVNALKAKLAAGAPYEPELNAATTALPGAGALNELKPFAAAGIPTLDALKASFAPVVTAVNATSATAPAAPAESSTWDLVMARLSSVVKVRHRSEVEWPDAVTEASRQLAENDLEGAVATLSRPADTPPAVSDWLTGAKARITADEAIRTAMEQALHQMSGNAN